MKCKCGHHLAQHGRVALGKKVVDGQCLIPNCECTLFVPTAKPRDRLLDELAYADLGAYDAEEQTLP